MVGQTVTNMSDKHPGCIVFALQVSISEVQSSRGGGLQSRRNRQMQAIFEFGEVYSFLVSVERWAACRYSVGVMFVAALNARLNGPSEP